MRTGFPSSGTEYDVLSVRRERSVATSVVPEALPAVVESVGAGKFKFGLRDSTAMMGEMEKEI